jgi:hypothetical protein
MLDIIYKDTNFSKEHLNWAYFIRVMAYCLMAGVIIWTGTSLVSQTGGIVRYVLFALVWVYYLFIRATVAIVDGKMRSKWWVLLGLLFWPSMLVLGYGMTKEDYENVDRLVNEYRERENKQLIEKYQIKQ